MKRLKDSSVCARSKAWNLAKNKNKLTEKEKAAFFFPAEDCVLAAASTEEPEEREFVVDSGVGMHMVTKRDVKSAELGDHEDIEKSDYGGRPTVRCKQEKKRQYVSNNWTYLSKLCFLKKIPQFFPW